MDPLDGPLKSTNMKTRLGIDRTGKWDPHQYILDAGWDFDGIVATAQRGVDADDLLKTQLV